MWPIARPSHRADVVGLVVPISWPVLMSIVVASLIIWRLWDTAERKRMDTAPVEYVIIDFPGNQFRGEIAPAIADLTFPETAVLSDDVVAQLKQLAELHEAGILTEEEFSAKKAQLLNL